MLLDTKYKQQNHFFSKSCHEFLCTCTYSFIVTLFREILRRRLIIFCYRFFFFLLLNRKIFNSSQINDFTLISKDITVDDHLYDESNLAPCH